MVLSFSSFSVQQGQLPCVYITMVQCGERIINIAQKALVVLRMAKIINMDSRSNGIYAGAQGIRRISKDSEKKEEKLRYIRNM